MTTETPGRFHLGDLLSITDGRLLSPDHIDGVYRIVDHVTGQKHMTHQLPRAAETIRPWLIEQHPWLDGLGPPTEADKADLISWLSWATTEHGEFHEVEPMPFGMYLGREPIAEAEEMVGPDRVVIVGDDPRPLHERSTKAIHDRLRFAFGGLVPVIGRLSTVLAKFPDLRPVHDQPRCYGPPALAIDGRAYRRRALSRRSRR